VSGPVFRWEVYGRVWTLRRPPLDDYWEPDTLHVEDVIDLIVAHLPANEEPDLRAALRADEDLDLDILTQMLDAVHDVVSPDIPRPAMRTLLDEFEKVRPLIHGQLLRSGHPKGTDGLNTYDAASIALAYLDEQGQQLAGWTFNEKARPALLKQLDIGPKAVTDLDALAALQSSMGMAPGQTSARPARKPDSPPAD
jgi:hypothetical protein